MTAKPKNGNGKNPSKGVPSGKAARRPRKTKNSSKNLQTSSDNRQHGQEICSSSVPIIGQHEKPKMGLAMPVGTQNLKLKTSTGQIQSRIKRFSNLQKILALGIVFVTAILIYGLLNFSSLPEKETKQARPKTQDTSLEPGVLSLSEPIKGIPPTKSGIKSSSAEPVSLQAAETFYLQQNYNKAYAVYKQLYEALGVGDQDESLRDFLQLKMAFCLEKADAADQANQLYRTLLRSRLPTIKTIAAYRLSLTDMQNKQYLQGRAKAYQAIALIDAIDYNRDWALSIERHCHFLVAESITRTVLSLCDADRDLPEELWAIPNEPPRGVISGRASRGSMDTDPFIALSQEQLRRFLDSGSEQLKRAVLSPQIENIQDPSYKTQDTNIESRVLPSAGRWSVTCYGASIEELLARFAARAGLDIQWNKFATGSEQAPIEIVDKTQDKRQKTQDTSLESGVLSLESWGLGDGSAARKRAVSLYLSSTAPQQFVTIAAGCAGLLARTAPDSNGGEKNVTIIDPSEYRSLSQHLSLLVTEAVSLWQAFLLTSAGDERIANAHFALALLQTQKDQLEEAIGEYKLIANRFGQTPLAPYALLASSRLKVRLRDYTGAREDLKQLIELYPESEFSDQACLDLADITMKAGLFQEASQLYIKVHNLGFSLQSQVAAALGAGKCFYQIEDYPAAAKWLGQYIILTKDNASIEFSQACFLLGKVYLAQAGVRAWIPLEHGQDGRAASLLEQACDALKRALAGRLDKQQYIEAVSSLVEAYSRQGRFVDALDILEKARTWQFSQKESVALVLLKANVLRCMGLIDKAETILGDRAQYILDAQLNAKISYDLAKCDIAKGNLEAARQKLTDILMEVEPGPLAHEVACDLADVCLKLNQSSQAVSVCLQLLDCPDLSATPAVRQKTLEILAAAQLQQKNYDGAVLALLGCPAANKEP